MVRNNVCVCVCVCIGFSVNDGSRSSVSHQYDEYCINKFEVFEVLVDSRWCGSVQDTNMKHDVTYLFGVDCLKWIFKSLASSWNERTPHTNALAQWLKA